MIAIGSDHGGFALKKALMEHLDKRGLAYKDYGTYSEASCDYPQYAKAVANAIVSGECERGILICGTGIGVSITANKIPGIRTLVVDDAVSCAAYGAGKMLMHLDMLQDGMMNFYRKRQLKG